MSTITPPQSMLVTYEWMTQVITARDGSEKRVALRQIPRQEINITHLIDTVEEIQNWKMALFVAIEDAWLMPLWGEAELITAAVTAGDSTVSADFSLMDDALGGTGTYMLILHPQERKYNIFTNTRTDTVATRLVGTFTEDFPIGSWVVPVEQVFLDNNTAYTPSSNNAAEITIHGTPKYNRALVGKNAVALTTHNTKPVLDRHPLSSGAQEVFSQKMDRLDYGHKIQVETSQPYANITSSRSYISRGKDERQWWKLFMTTVRGMQKSFYCSTYRHDLTLYEQPAQGAATFNVLYDADVVAVWQHTSSHTELAVSTADGDTQLVSISSATDNGDGTHNVVFTPALTNTALGSTVERISFLELVRLGSDKVTVEHLPAHSLVSLTVRTIQE